ncbi:MAG: anhydro-N-acetylmuramic acid kinase [Sulfurimonas sp.]|jgi:anhydro-N-acetylmuramic acid kinase|uniref:anhydro-N-acetylmuramic acid kinase n=1 Tax=Sulfurimonas sp. TaxID=2022749 RepID=UPI0039E36941
MGSLYIGVMSGTSLDGVDIALCKIDNASCTLVYSHEYPFPKELQEEILKLITNQTTLAEVGTLNIKLGNLFAASVNTFVEENEINIHEVVAIGLHGQTLWHAPESEFPFSMQLGCPNVVSTQTGMKVVADFRSMDVANGGQGAPFAPAFHEFLFSHVKEKAAVINIGGMANITILGENLKGWDTGVGNVLLDSWVKECKYFPYDQNGQFAESGEVDEALLQSFLSDPYFDLRPPKSTGREYFNWEWLSKHIQEFQSIPQENIQRTLLELTAQTITNAVKNTDINLLIICGGGAKNSFLMQRLDNLFAGGVQKSDALNISGDYMEAMAFAWFAYKRINNEEVNLRSVTGARKNSILGGKYG